MPDPETNINLWLQRFWQHDLVTFPLHHLLDERNADFLATVGLPIHYDWDHFFCWWLTFHAPLRAGERLLIGGQGGVQFYVDLASQTVKIENPHLQDSPTRVNSDLQRFVYFASRAVDYNRNPSLEGLQALLEHFKQVDPQALQEENWWDELLTIMIEES